MSLKNWQRLSHSGERFDLVRLKQAMMLLIANDAPLGPEWRDHPLKGEWADHRECHTGGDFLLIYQLEANTTNFVRSGTHSELFGSGLLGLICPAILPGPDPRRQRPPWRQPGLRIWSGMLLKRGKVTAVGAKGEGGFAPAFLQSFSGCDTWLHAVEFPIRQ